MKYYGILFRERIAYFKNIFFYPNFYILAIPIKVKNYLLKK